MGLSTLLICALLVLSTRASEPIEDKSGFALMEKLTATGPLSKRLVFEKFTRNIYTVPGYSGRESTASDDPPFEPSLECGDRFVNLTEGAFGTVTSPNYPHAYPSNIQCEWIISGIPGTVVEATFFDVVTQPWLFSYSDYLLISNTGNWDKYRRFAGDVNHKMPFTFVSTENRLGIRLITSKWLNFRGFKMSYIVRGMKPDDSHPPENEYGSAFNNDLVAVCSSKPMSNRINTKFITREESEEHKAIRIVNGIETLPHQFPFMVAILVDEDFFCGGSLIDQNHVLTAAHCVDQAMSVDLFFGVYNMSNRAENLYARQYRTVQFPDTANNIFVHQNYDARSGSSDIAIVRFNQVKITKYVQPVFLPSVYSTSNSFSGWNLRTLGWGSVKGGHTMMELTPVLREASATVITTSDCRHEFSGSVTGKNICTRDPIKTPASTPSPVTEAPVEVSTSAAETTLPSEEVTTIVPGESADSENIDTETVDKVQYQSPCHGDSGGPLFAEFVESANGMGMESAGLNLNKAGPSSHECVNAKKNGAGNAVRQQHDTACQRPKDSNERWYVQVGVLSFGSQVCGERVPVAYTRVTAYLQWIAYITGRHG